MADNPYPHLDEDTRIAAPRKKGVKRRAFLIGSALLVGGGAFGVYWGDRSARARAKALTETGKDHNFLNWMKIRRG